MAEEINQVIDNLCEKLGTTATALAPEMARYMVAKNITSIVVTTILYIIMLLIFRYILKRLDIKDDGLDEDEVKSSVLLLELITGLVFTAIYICNLVEKIVGTVGWIASPQAALIKEITSMVG